MEIALFIADSTHKIIVTEKGITYHSVYDTFPESMHVFIEAGLQELLIIDTGHDIHGGGLLIFEMFLVPD